LENTYNLKEKGVSYNIQDKDKKLYYEGKFEFLFLCKGFGIKFAELLQ